MIDQRGMMDHWITMEPPKSLWPGGIGGLESIGERNHFSMPLRHTVGMDQNSRPGEPEIFARINHEIIVVPNSDPYHLPYPYSKQWVQVPSKAVFRL